MLVAGRRRIEEDDPGHVALVLLCILGRVAKSSECCLIAAIEDGSLEHVVVGLVDNVEQELLPLRPRIQGCLHATGSSRVRVLQELSCHIHELVDVLLAVRTCNGLQGLIERNAERLAFCCMSQL